MLIPIELRSEKKLQTIGRGMIAGNLELVTSVDE